jgi:hypothetical protein
MKRTPMRRTKPLRQSRRHGADVEREPKPMARSPAVPPLVRGTYAGTTSGVPVAKEQPMVCEAYRRLVRSLPCALCGYPPPSQFCHADQGKGMGLKSDDRTGWPGCGPHPEANVHDEGCHHYVGTSGKLPKQARRNLERELARKTRAEIERRGLWPHLLPKWSEA